MFGSGANSTQKAVEASKKAEAMGADGLLVVTPYYNKCTQGGLYEHYKAVAESVKIPVICYNVPARTGVNILPATMERIAQIPNIAGIKEACGNMEQICETARRIRGKCDLYSGDDNLNLPILAIGGAGSFRSRRTSSRAKQNRCTNTLRRRPRRGERIAGQDAARHRPAFHRGQPHPPPRKRRTSSGWTAACRACPSPASNPNTRAPSKKRLRRSTRRSYTDTQARGTPPRASKNDRNKRGGL